MDPIYIPQYDGYIIDNPNIDFVRCDGKVFSYDEVNTANMSDTSNSLTVNGGQRRSPLAYIDTDRNTELTFTSSLFTLEMFEMANAEEIEHLDTYTLETKVFEWEPHDMSAITFYSEGKEEPDESDFIGTGICKIVIPYVIKFEWNIDAETDYYWKGINVKTQVSVEENGSIVPSAQYTSWNRGTSFIPFYRVGDKYYNYLPETDDVIETVLFVGDLHYDINELGAPKPGYYAKVTGKRRIVNGDRVTVKTDSTTAKGSFYAHYPLYSSGSDCTESSQKGTLHIYFPKCRATALPGFDAAYKSAQAPGVTFSTIDPKRADKKIFDIMYESKDGEISLADTTIAFASSGMQDVTLESGANYFTLNVPAVVTDPPMWAAFGDLPLSSSIQLNKGDVYEITGIPDDLPISFTKFELSFVGIVGSNKVINITNPVVRFVSNGETITKISATFMVRERVEEPTSIEVTPTIKKVIDWD